MGERRFGLLAETVRELARAVAIVPLPASPANIEGVIDFRGHLVPVFDVRASLGLPAKAIALSDHLIIAEVRRRLIALRIDRAVELREVVDEAGPSGREADPPTGGGSRIMQLGDGLAPILDLTRLFSERDISTLGTFLPSSWERSEEL